MICWFKQEECSHLMPASLVYSKSVIECLLHCLLNIPRNIGDAFFYVITCVYTSWKTVVLLFLFHVLDCNAIFANQDLLPTLRPGNFDLHTKMPGSTPAWTVVHKCPVCADLLVVGRRSERLCRRLVRIWFVIRTLIGVSYFAFDGYGLTWCWYIYRHISIHIGTNIDIKG